MGCLIILICRIVVGGLNFVVGELWESLVVTLLHVAEF